MSAPKFSYSSGAIGLGSSSSNNSVRGSSPDVAVVGLLTFFLVGVVGFFLAGLDLGLGAVAGGPEDTSGARVDSSATTSTSIGSA